MRLVDADRLTDFFWLPSSGTDEVIDEYIAKYPELKTESLESCQALCRDMIQGLINVIDKQPTAYDIDKVIEQLQHQIDQYRRRADKAKQRGYNSESYHNYGKACSYEHALEIVRGE